MSDLCNFAFMVLIDRNKTTGWSHMVASTESELHEFAKKVRCNRFSNKRGKFQPHYDLTEEEFKRAIDLGAVLVSPKTIVKFLQAHYGKGLDKKQMSQMVFLADLIRYSFENKEETISDKNLKKIDQIMDKSEKVFEEFESENEEVASHLATLFAIKEIFS